MGDVLWQLEGVTVAGAGRPRLRGVSCVIERGVTLVLGPSGAGKTTLLDLLVDFAVADSGHVTFRGRSRAWAPADFGLWPHLRVRDHVALVHAWPSDTADGMVDDLLVRLRLDDVAKQYPGSLSSGQQSRLALARALATGAEALVLDEPFAHLDEDSAACARAVLLSAARDEGRALVVATHAGHRLDDVATRRLELRDGTLWANAAARMLLVLCGFVLTFVGACRDGTLDPAPTPTQRSFVLPPEGARAPAPRAIAPGAADTWLVLDDAGRVLEYAADGALRRQWSMPDHSVGNPEGVCALRDGRIVVADTHYHRLVFFAADTTVQSMVGTEGTGPLQFGYPVSVVQDADGDLFVAEYGGNDRVQRLRADGTFVLAFGAFGTGTADLQRPAGLACRGELVYVADAMNGRIQVFTRDGRYVRSLPPDQDLACPYDVALADDGMLFVVEYGGGCLTLMDTDGHLRAHYGRPGRGADELATPWSVAVRGGIALIADTGNRRLVEVRR
ncbi:MAG: ATP-binding cassette domain-containing protein [Planctomycetota bacterium]